LEEKEIIISNNIKIRGEFIESSQIDELYYDDFSTSEVEEKVLSGEQFKFNLKNFSIFMKCPVYNKTDSDIFNLIEKEKLKVNFPSFIIDGKKFEFETIYFVHK